MENLMKFKQLFNLFIALALAGTSFVSLPARPARAATLTVTNTNDSGAGSLRQAILDAVDGDTIDATSISGTITLTSQIIIGFKSITIQGPGSDQLTVSGNNAVGVFYIEGAGKTYSISGLTVANGRVVDNSGAGIKLNSGSLFLDDVNVINNATVKNTFDYNRGGGIYVHDGTSLTMSNGSVSGNTSQQNGGGIHVSFNAYISLDNVVIDNNSLEFYGSDGGGVSIRQGSTAILNRVTVTNNTAKFGGGGLSSDASLTITNSVFATNSVVSANDGSGGGLYIGNNNNTYIIENTTISGNSVFRTASANATGGGVSFVGPATFNLNNVTIANNTSQYDGGGMFKSSNAVVNINNSIIAGNAASNSTVKDCYGTINSQGYNLIQVTTGCTINGTTTGNVTGSAPDLAPLGNYGGPTLTHALLPTSPALDAADNATCETQDQRGITRPQDGDLNSSAICDIGAFEYAIFPTVTSITRASTSPTTAASVDFTVTFSEDVQNVDVNDFSLTKTGSIIGETVASVSGSGSAYTVSVNTGSGTGTLRLDVPDTATIQDANSNPLSGTPFTSGQSYTKVISVTYKSNPANDGWVLESTETSNTGGSMDSTATTFILGDNAADRQYRTILHFDTSSLPDNAVVTSLTLKIKQQGAVTGVSPFNFGSLYVDMRNPAFGNSILELADFNFAAKKIKSAVFNPNPVSGWFSARFNTGGRLYVNRTGVTQLRLYFSVDDNNNNIADFIRFFSGNASADSRPKLLIQYQLP
jgi:predicted outer membrane repeat protein